MKIDPEKYKDLRKSRPWDFTDDKEILELALPDGFTTIKDAEDSLSKHPLWYLVNAYITVAGETQNKILDKEIGIQFEEELDKFFNE